MLFCPPCLRFPGCTLELEGTLGTVLRLQFFVIQRGPGTQSGLRDGKLLSNTCGTARLGSANGEGALYAPMGLSELPLSAQVRKEATSCPTHHPVLLLHFCSDPASVLHTQPTASLP